MGRNAKCPDCGGALHKLGRHFKAPPKDDLKQWEKVAFLVDNGFFFQRVYDDHVQVPYPSTLQEARDFVRRYKSQALKEEGG